MLWKAEKQQGDERGLGQELVRELRGRRGAEIPKGPRETAGTGESVPETRGMRETKGTRKTRAKTGQAHASDLRRLG
jgi:hypothetical protein